MRGKIISRIMSLSLAYKNRTLYKTFSCFNSIELLKISNSILNMNLQQQCSLSTITSDDNSSDENPSTKSTDENLILKQLNEVLQLRDTLVSSWIVESRLKKLCNAYRCSSGDDKREFLIALGMHYTVNHQMLCDTFAKISEEKSDVQIAKYEDKLRNLLVPQYHWLFLHIGRIEHGVKFLVDLRTEIRCIMRDFDSDDIKSFKLQQLNSTLMEMLSLWFSVGFLTLERITWKSSCEMLEKISEYEVVHPIRNWTDLKRRVGPYRRCFVFKHSSMPDEPLVVLHTALSDQIHTSMASITANARRMSRITMLAQDADNLDAVEDSSKIKAAVFYSVASTQEGLHGIELGNYLIKRVVSELISEFPCISQFSTLSPIPKFKKWLYDKLKSAEKNNELLQELFTKDEIENLQKILNCPNIVAELRKLLNNNEWIEEHELCSSLKQPLMRLCAYYLFLEKRRRYAFDSVAHFHLRNGAVMWRLNWLADVSPRGVGNSCGLMINYRYFLNEAETNSRNYIENFQINASDQIRDLASHFQKTS